MLSGAIKLFREGAGNATGRFRHHTMLVHESVKQSEHRELADAIRHLWKTAGYYGSAGMARLEDLYAGEMVPVMEARAGNEAIPSSFADIKPFIGEVVSRVEGSANDPVLIINGDAEVAAADIDFEKRQIWKVLVGGTKLSRGFTIEGLTVSFYRRKTQQADTLMQMGRWFGFRDGYRDLVRLYIRRGELATGGNSFDLYLAFEASCRSEELFRAELVRYAKVEDGVPVITPAQVPPLVAQHLGWLKPAASNKMYNARLVERRSPGEHLEPTGYPDKPTDIEHNAQVLSPLIELATSEAAFAYPTASGQRTYPGRYGIVGHEALVSLLKQLRWLPPDHFEADFNWLQDLTPNQIEDWVVILPQHAGAGPKANLLGHESLSVLRGQRRRAPLFGAISDPKHRPPANRIAGVGPLIDGCVTEELHRAKRGALLVYPWWTYPPTAMSQMSCRPIE